MARRRTPAAFRNLGVPPHWQIYLLVSDGDAAATIDKNLGAKLHMPPMNIQEIGRMAVMAYPQGAAFAVFATVRRRSPFSPIPVGFRKMPVGYTQLTGRPSYGEGFRPCQMVLPWWSM